MDFQRLPVPELCEDMHKHRHKQFHEREDSNRFRPPKYKRYSGVDNNNFNRSQSVGLSGTNSFHIAHSISFRGPESPNSSTLPVTSQSLNENHFEQCFERLAKLGEGSFGEVFQVRDRSDGQLYAVKISKQLFRGEQYRAERLEEVRRYEEFSGHENCIRFIRAWEQYDRLFMQMELCRESLEQYLWRRKYIPEERIWSILLDLLCGLKSLHDRNLIHLDIKLDNVLIDDDDTCKLADFGLVIDVDKANNHQATEGDSRYMAPEILQGHFSKAADIFSLGIAMLELAGMLDLPSNGPLWHELRQGILPEEFINQISVELQEIIRSMMSPDPLQRPTVEQLLSHAKLSKMQRKQKSMATLKRLGAENGTLTAPSSPTASIPLAPRLEFHLVGSTPIANREGVTPDFLGGDDALELSQQGTPSAYERDKLDNSTPLNHSKSRLDVSKRSIGSARKTELPSSNLLNIDSNLSSPKVLDTSSFRRKKLFVQDSDEE
ncbi:membrane-associated tyrosine- and threonine-specific cdc2-inhibitory kinase isoform X2 [Scaptodrosophila lebanonensis]|uniref:Membrane-associated tyrosine- and threonine-specific cdc2-inhibitory kinase n=1 Tax=Drosophila lebanonensis TaxID=7225 RepID=A0A6J2TXC0_DROLE|nr:membrane-associated tyrosine- and threonine-specific cdc2-inhibitory kinase isoform X2 [Scaptodrosophila lebanonensis]